MTAAQRRQINEAVAQLEHSRESVMRAEELLRKTRSKITTTSDPALHDMLSAVLESMDFQAAWARESQARIRQINTDG